MTRYTFQDIARAEEQARQRYGDESYDRLSTRTKSLLIKAVIDKGE